MPRHVAPLSAARQSRCGPVSTQTAGSGFDSGDSRNPPILTVPHSGEARWRCRAQLTETGTAGLGCPTATSRRSFMGTANGSRRPQAAAARPQRLQPGSTLSGNTTFVRSPRGQEEGLQLAWVQPALGPNTRTEVHAERAYLSDGAGDIGWRKAARKEHGKLAGPNKFSAHCPVMRPPGSTKLWRRRVWSTRSRAGKRET